MASPLTVKVHPVVYLSIVDSYERRSQRAGMNTGALGTLLGIYEKNVVQVTNCYAIPYRESDNDVPEINDVFNKQMWAAHKRASPAEQIVGWFTTNSHLSSSCTVYHSYYTSLIAEINVKKELPPVVLLTMDVSFSGETRGRLPVHAFISGIAGVPAKAIQAHIFQPLKVELDAFPGEAVALDFIMKGIEAKQSGVQMESSLDQLEKTSGKMVECLEQLLAYVDKVLADVEPSAEASRLGRKLMEAVNKVTSQIPQEKLDALVKNSLRDYSMIAYLSELAKTQLSLQEKEKQHMPPEQMDKVETTKPQEEDDGMQAYYPGLFGCRNAEREFDFLNKIEEGTYGVVFRAYEKRTGKVMALKRLKTEEDEDFPITSLREINTLLKCRGHPNIVNVQEVVCNATMSQVYLVMEYVEHDAKSFMELMRKKGTRFTLAQVKALMRQLLSGLARIHEEFIIHRDLKPSNLLLSHGGVLKIGDFGLARKFDDPLRPYTPIVVTLWYRCPELLLGTKLYSTAVDMWSVGCIFAEFLKLQALFPGKSELDQLSLIFSIIGSPNSNNWPGFDELPYVKQMRVPEVPFNCLREKYNRELEASEAGVDMLKSFLAHCPEHRMSAEEALKSGWFTEDPEAAKPEDFPLYPAKSEKNKRPRPVASQDVEVSPGRLKLLAAHGVDAKTAPKAGFQLKFSADEPATKKHKRR